MTRKRIAFTCLLLAALMTTLAYAKKPKKDLTITDVDHVVPEGGQSMTTVQQDIIDRVALQIVQQMEMPW